MSLREDAIHKYLKKETQNDEANRLAVERANEKHMQEATDFFKEAFGVEPERVDLERRFIIHDGLRFEFVEESYSFDFGRSPAYLRLVSMCVECGEFYSSSHVIKDLIDLGRALENPNPSYHVGCEKLQGLKPVTNGRSPLEILKDMHPEDPTAHVIRLVGLSLVAAIKNLADATGGL